MESVFTPAAGHVVSAGVGINMEGQEGVLLVTVIDQGQIVCQEQFSLAEYEGNVIHSFPVDWHLKKGRDYTLRVEPSGISGSLYAYVTEEDSIALTELKGAVIAGEDWGGQPLMSLGYSQLPTSQRRLALLVGAWIGMLEALVIAAYSLIGRKDNLRGKDDGQENKL